MKKNMPINSGAKWILQKAVELSVSYSLTVFIWGGGVEQVFKESLLSLLYPFQAETMVV